MSQSGSGDAAAAPPANADTTTEPSASRRDLLPYGAVAFGAAAAAGTAASPVEAADGGSPPHWQQQQRHQPHGLCFSVRCLRFQCDIVSERAATVSLASRQPSRYLRRHGFARPRTARAFKVCR